MSFFQDVPLLVTLEVASTEITSDNVSDLKAFAKATNEYPEDITEEGWCCGGIKK